MGWMFMPGRLLEEAWHRGCLPGATIGRPRRAFERSSSPGAHQGVPAGLAACRPRQGTSAGGSLVPSERSARCGHPEASRRRGRLGLCVVDDDLHDGDSAWRSRSRIAPSATGVHRCLRFLDHDQDRRRRPADRPPSAVPSARNVPSDMLNDSNFSLLLSPHSWVNSRDSLLPCLTGRTYASCWGR